MSRSERSSCSPSARVGVPHIVRQSCQCPTWHQSCLGPPYPPRTGLSSRHQNSRQSDGLTPRRRLTVNHLGVIVGETIARERAEQLIPLITKNPYKSTNLCWITNRQQASRSFVRSFVWERQRLTVSQGKTTTMSKFLACLLLCSPVGGNLVFVYSTSLDRAQEVLRAAKVYIDWIVTDPPSWAPKIQKVCRPPKAPVVNGTVGPWPQNQSLRLQTRPTTNAPFLPAGQVGRNDSVGRSETMNVWSQSTTVNPQSTIASHVPEELQGAEETPHTVHSSTRSSPPNSPSATSGPSFVSSGWTFGPVP